MNTIYIHDGCIDLIGFDKLNDKAYFSFRNGGLAISSKVMDINNPQKDFIITKKQILDQKLASLLTLYGFSKPHSFTIIDQDTYICNYPDIAPADYDELLKKYGNDPFYLELIKETRHG